MKPPNTPIVPGRRPWPAAAALLALLVAACATTPEGPVFYPNDHYRSAGEAAARSALADCKARARAAGLSERADGQVLRKAAVGGLLGAAAGAAWGAIWGGDVAQRAAAVAAAGAATGAVSGGIESATQTDPTFRAFVARCLRERGYEILRWE